MHSDVLLTCSLATERPAESHNDHVPTGAVEFVRRRLKTRSTFLAEFLPRRAMQIPLNSREHRETLKAFYSTASSKTEFVV